MTTVLRFPIENFVFAAHDAAHCGLHVYIGLNADVLEAPPVRVQRTGSGEVQAPTAWQVQKRCLAPTHVFSSLLPLVDARPRFEQPRFEKVIWALGGL